MDYFERRFCTQTQKLNSINSFYMSEINSKKFHHNAAFLSSTPIHCRSLPLKNVTLKEI